MLPVVIFGDPDLFETETNHVKQTCNQPSNPYFCVWNYHRIQEIFWLAIATDPRWVNLAEKSLEDILTDHAYCEQKAATSCISLVQRYSDKEKLVYEFSPIVTEEWGHFRSGSGRIAKTKFEIGSKGKDEYVNELAEFRNKRRQ